MEQKTQKHDLHGKLGSTALSGAQREPDTGSPQYKHWQITLGVLSASLTVLALMMTLFFTLAHGSLTDITVANVPVRATSGTAQLQQQIVAATKNYKVSFVYTNGSHKSFPLKSTGITVDAKQSAANAKQTINGSLLRRLEWWKPIRLSLATKIDQQVFQAFVTNDATEVKTPPKDANLAIVNGSVVVSQEAQGSGSSIVNAPSAITYAVANLVAAPLKLKPVKLSAAITAVDLKSSQSKAQTLLSQPVVFTIAGNTVTAKPTDIADWTELTPVPKSKTVDVTVDSGKILQYIDKISKWYIQPPRSRLVTNTSDGEIVLDPGADGVDVVDKDKTAATVATQLLQNKAVNINLAVNYAAAKTVEVQAYDKWIVADVTTKRMYAYEKTNLVRSFLVSAGAPATPTVIGHYTIYAKYAAQDMRGFNADGSRYFQPSVPYVNYFYGSYAIHGNYWRPQSYFGNINSSHGCVGLDVSDAEWVYNWAPIGTPVITHT